MRLAALLVLFIKNVFVLSSSPGGGAAVIINGANVQGSEFPSYVAQLRVIPDYPSVCGSVLISSRFLLTAAHCVYNNENDMAMPHFALFHSTYNTRASSQVLQSSSNTIAIKRITVNPLYNETTLENDIAIIELVSNAVSIKPVVLSKSTSTRSSTITYGWGRTVSQDKSSSSTVLKSTKSVLSTSSQCKEAASNGLSTEASKSETRKAAAKNLQFLPSSMVCTINNKDDVSSGVCHGDSGGPLIIKKKLVGITSWVPFVCGEVGYPSVFTRVSSQKKFIDSVSKGHQWETL